MTQVVVLHGAVPDGAPPDRTDTLVQAASVTEALEALGHTVDRVSLTLDLAAVERELRSIGPGFVFNLVEDIDGHDNLLPLGPMLLDSMRIPYTGCAARALHASTDKLTAKRLMRSACIPTPAWIETPGATPAPSIGRYIVKSATEHASFAIDAGSVVAAGDINGAIRARRARHGGTWFAEAFIDGREFNLSLLGGDGRPLVLPPAEIGFVDFPADQPRIVGYAAKWDEASPLYAKTVRRLDFGAADTGLLRHLSEIARDCWHAFGLAGYARVDFRVDADGKPWVLEINANPCLSPNAGFVAAAERAGLGFVDIIARIVADIRHDDIATEGPARI